MKSLNHIVIECSNQAQKGCKTRHDYLGKWINEKFNKILKFDHTINKCIHKPESVLENKTHKIPEDFEIKTDHLIPTTKPRLSVNW